MNLENLLDAQAHGQLSNEALYLLDYYVQAAIYALRNVPYPEVSGAHYFLCRQRDELQRMIDARARHE